MPGMKSVVGMGGMGDARELAEMLRQLGRGNDTVLAHITPEEAQMLKDMGGSGTINPDTGLPEFLDIYGGSDSAQFDYGQRFNPAASPDFDLGESIRAQQGADVFYREPQYGEMSDMAVQEPFIPNRDVEAQAGGFYGGVPSASELARMRFAEQQMAQPEPSRFARGAQAIEDVATRTRELAREYPNVARLLSTGATTLPALLQASRARQAGEAAAEQFRRLGEPLRTQGEALRQQAVAGGLTPQQAAAQEAQRARLRQAASGRGTTTGTQAAMIENQLARARSEMAQTNLNNAIRLLNLANAYDEEAIRAKLASDQRINTLVGNIFANLGRTTGATRGGGGTMQETEQQRPPVTQRPRVPTGEA